jgi:D-alanyl-D-alanine carboxypeptidase
VEASATTTVARPAPAPAVEAVNTVVVASNEPAVIAPSTKMQTPGRSVIAKSDSARSEAPRAEAARPEVTRVEATKPEAAKTEVAKLESAKPEAVKSEPAKSEPAKSEPAKSEPAKPVAAKTEIVKPEPSAAQIRARGGWIIQIGAFEAEEEAKQHLSEARLKIPHILASADPFTERVQKGDKALYRARFAGFDKANAEAACKQLKRSDIACMTVKN